MSGTLIRIAASGDLTSLRWEKKGPPNWETRSDLVGGYIERVKVRWEGRTRDAYVDENGFAKDLPHNPHVGQLLCSGFEGSTIVGPLVIWVPDAKVKKGAS